MSLGINKDLEPLARRVRKAGGVVEISRSNHVRWWMPCGCLIRSGLTMSGTTAQLKRREIQKALGCCPCLTGVERRTAC